MGGSVYTSLSPRSMIWFDCLCLSEPKINASDQIILPLDGSIKPVWLKCNLTTAQTPHKDSFWMKNGQEITNTRTEQRNTAYRWQTLTLSLFNYFRDWKKKRKEIPPAIKKKNAQQYAGKRPIRVVMVDLAQQRNSIASRSDEAVFSIHKKQLLF